MGIFSIYHLIVGIVCASTFYKAAAMEDHGPSPIYWAALSAAVYLLAWLLLGWGWWGILYTQLALALAIGLVRVALHFRKAKP